MRQARLDELQAGIKISGRNTNNLRYADDTTLKAESKEEWKRLLVRVKEESEKASLKLNIKKTKIMAPSLITSWQIEGEKVYSYIYFITCINSCNNHGSQDTKLFHHHRNLCHTMCERSIFYTSLTF